MLLEEKIRPNLTTNTVARDLLTASLLAGLAAVLLARGLTPYLQTQQWPQLAEALQGWAAMTISPYLLLALGFALALRRGAVDLSMAAVSCLGGLTAALLIRAGVWPSLALAAGAMVGLTIGTLHGLAVAFLRLPSPLVTLGTAALLVFVLPHAVTPEPGQPLGPRGGPRQVTVPPGTFDSWHLTQQPEGEGDEDDSSQAVQMPPSFTRLVLTAALYVLCLLAMMLVNTLRNEGFQVAPRWQMVAALASSGVLAALAGGLWLIEFGFTPVATRMIDDLRPASAAVMAGAVLLAGRGRTLLVMIFLPLALLLSILWRQNIWLTQAFGQDLQMVLLLLMLLVTQTAMRNVLALRTIGNKTATGAMVATGCGMILLAQTGNMENHTSRQLFMAAAMLSFLAGISCLMVSRLRTSQARRSQREAQPTVTPPPA